MEKSSLSEGIFERKIVALNWGVGRVFQVAFGEVIDLRVERCNLDRGIDNSFPHTRLGNSFGGDGLEE